ncbi:hypothetical protein [uncultured Chryseobacterium sp.]|uniref:hypothetical protein n=1 Tax=uncultured Chryseobacterium sp. TaxID=259322 RepID=UPI0025FD445E|nr:hypothetical protein [uncultured Chryseobacterium sp.]
MRIGIICEGHSDRAVLENILKGIVDIDSNDLIALRPQYLFDETDLHIKKDIEFSNWSLVMMECKRKELIEDFLETDGDFIVIHLDTAEADQYSVTRPIKQKTNHNYCHQLRKEVVSKIDEWLEKSEIIERTFHAVTIEEMDAWILTIYYDKNTCSSVSPKEKLQYELNRKNISSIVDYDNYKSLSKDFSKKKKVQKGNFLDKNCSLELFVEEVTSKII